jgi:hypothetical protein
MERTLCDSILQFGIWEDVQSKEKTTYQRVVSKVFTQNKVLDNNSSFNWSQAFSGIVPQEFSPVGIPMKWDGTFNVNGNKRKYFSEAIADQFLDDEFYQREYEYIAHTASTAIIDGWNKCLKTLEGARGLRCQVGYPEEIPDNSKSIALRIDITKTTLTGENGSGAGIYLAKKNLITTFAKQGLELRQDSFPDDKLTLRENEPKRIVVTVPPKKRGIVIDIPIISSNERYSSWVSFIAPLSADSPLNFPEVADDKPIPSWNHSFTIFNDSNHRMVARVKVKFQFEAEDRSPQPRWAKCNYRVLDMTDTQELMRQGFREIFDATPHTTELIADVHIAPRSSRDLLAQIFNDTGLNRPSNRIITNISKSSINCNR